MARPATAETKRFQMLGHDFAVRTTRDLAEHIDRTFSTLRVPGRPAHHYDLDAVEGERSEVWSLRYDGHVLMEGPSVGACYSHLCWHINREAIDRCDDLLLLHSACAATADGRGVLLPAAMESGKSTTVAGLVRAGMHYLTDEATAIEPATGGLRSCAKPLSIDPGSWEVLADLRPEVSPDAEPLLEWQWQVPADSFGTVAGSAMPALVVSPRYVAGASVHLDRLSPADALMLLAENAFNLQRFGHDGFAALEHVARTCPTYRMEHGDLDEAVRTIGRLLADIPHPREDPAWASNTR